MHENLAGDFRDVSATKIEPVRSLFGIQHLNTEHFALSKEPIESVNDATRCKTRCLVPTFASTCNPRIKKSETSTKIFIAFLFQLKTFMSSSGRSSLTFPGNAVAVHPTDFVTLVKNKKKKLSHTKK